jgi:hypothetical protein
MKINALPATISPIPPYWCSHLKIPSTLSSRGQTMVRDILEEKEPSVSINVKPDTHFLLLIFFCLLAFEAI